MIGSGNLQQVARMQRSGMREIFQARMRSNGFDDRKLQAIFGAIAREYRDLPFFHPELIEVQTRTLSKNAFAHRLFQAEARFPAGSRPQPGGRQDQNVLRTAF